MGPGNGQMGEEGLKRGRGRIEKTHITHITFYIKENNPSPRTVLTDVVLHQ